MFKKVYSLYSAFCTQPAFYSQSAVCILALVCSLQSAVRSPQSSFYTDLFFLSFENLLDVVVYVVDTFDKQVGSVLKL